MLRGTCVAASATVKRDGRFQISNPTFHLNKLEEEQTKPQAAGGRNEKEHRAQGGNSRGEPDTEHRLFEKTNDAGRALARPAGQTRGTSPVDKLGGGGGASPPLTLQKHEGRGSAVSRGVASQQLR